MVVIKGLAITTGSKPSFLASNGRVQPTNLAQTTVKARVKETIKLTVVLTPCPIIKFSNSIIFANVNTAKVKPQRTETLSSFH